MRSLQLLTLVLLATAANADWTTVYTTNDGGFTIIFCNQGQCSGGGAVTADFTIPDNIGKPVAVFLILGCGIDDDCTDQENGDNGCCAPSDDPPGTNAS